VFVTAFLLIIRSEFVVQYVEIKNIFELFEPKLLLWSLKSVCSVIMKVFPSAATFDKLICRRKIQL